MTDGTSPPGFEFTGVERLTHRPDEELLLRALVQTFLDHSLCVAEETPQGRHLVFPSQYRREKDIPHEPDIFVSYSFSGEWQTVWTALVVRLWYSNEFKHLDELFPRPKTRKSCLSDQRRPDCRGSLRDPNLVRRATHEKQVLLV